MAEKKIGGKVFRVQPMNAIDALALYMDIMRILGPSASRLPSIIVALGSSEEGADMMAEVATLAAISDILQRTATDTITDVLRRIIELTSVSVDGGKNFAPTIMDVEFTGDLKSLVPVIKFVMEEQYSDFFTGSRPSGILSLLTEVLQKRKSAA